MWHTVIRVTVLMCRGVIIGGQWMIREITKDDLGGLLSLYTQLHNNPLPEQSEELEKLWQQIVEDKHQHIIVAEEDGKIVSSCALLVVPNLTHSQRPYALVENVITDDKYRKQGLAAACLNFAKGIAESSNCYKIMLLSGSKQEAAHRLYEQLGYNKNDKTAFIQWLDI